MLRDPSYNVATEPVDSGSVVWVGILARVSSTKQAEKVSIEEQIAACLAQADALARELGRPVKVFKIYKDAGVSGDGRDRQGLNEAMMDAAAGRIVYLIIYDVDRLSRDPLQGLETLYKCTSVGARIVVCGMQLIYDPETGDLDFGSLLQFVVKLLIGKEERRQMMKRTSRDRLALVHKGIQVQRGRAPYGYRIWQTWEAKAGQCKAEDVGRYSLSPDLLTQQVITEVFERAARRETLRGIGKILQARGVPSPSGATLWYPNTVREIVTDSVYKGVAHYGRRKRQTDKRREAEGKKIDFDVRVPEAQWIPLPAPRIVSDELWQAANDALDENKRFRSGDVEKRFLLSGVLRCPGCGASMGGRREGHATIHYYVCCRDYLKYEPEGSHAAACTFQRYVRSHIIESRVVQALTVACLKPAVVQMAVRDFLAAAAANARGDEAERERAALIDRKERLTRRLRSIRQSMADVRAVDETANVSGFAEDYALEAAALEKVDAQLRAMPEPRKVADALPDPAEVAARVSASLARIPEALASPLMTAAEKRLLLDAVLLRAVPIEGAHGPRNSIDWAVKITLRPGTWNAAAFGNAATSQGVYGSSAG